jgi:hypothetical protein
MYQIGIKRLLAVFFQNVLQEINNREQVLLMKIASRLNCDTSTTPVVLTLANDTEFLDAFSHGCANR